MTTLEEMAADLHERLRLAYGYSRRWESVPDHLRTMMRAALVDVVLEKHVGPLLAQAYHAGMDDIAAASHRPSGAKYAAHILTQLKASTNGK